jgi:hypothetical protein
MKLAIAIAVVLASGCTSTWSGWDDVPTSPVFATSDIRDLAAPWAAQVAKDINTWNTALGDVGCPAPFKLGDAGRPVELVPIDEWGLDSTVRGQTDDDRIRVRPALLAINGVFLDHPALLLHELGHAIGLNHSDSVFGPSVMTLEPTADTLQPRDIAAAACVMGCGPCDQPDPYAGE